MLVLISPASSMFWYLPQEPVDEPSLPNKSWMFYAVKCQDLFGRDGSSTGPWGKYQNIDESSALKNLDRPVQALLSLKVVNLDSQLDVFYTSLRLTPSNISPWRERNNHTSGFESRFS